MYTPKFFFIVIIGMTLAIIYIIKTKYVYMVWSLEVLKLWNFEFVIKMLLNDYLINSLRPCDAYIRR